MPRPKKQTGSPSYSPGQAHYVLNRLIDERRLSHGEVSRYVNDMHGEISSLEQRLASLRAAAGHGGASSSSSSSGASPAPAGRRRGRPPGSGRKAGASGAGAGAGASSSGSSSTGSSAAAPAQRGPRGRRAGSGAGASSGGGARKKSALSPEQLASRQLQGRYLGLIRQIPATRRAQYQKIAKERGREAAIREMQDNLKK